MWSLKMGSLPLLLSTLIALSCLAPAAAAAATEPSSKPPSCYASTNGEPWSDVLIYALDRVQNVMIALTAFILWGLRGERERWREHVANAPDPTIRRTAFTMVAPSVAHGN